MTKLTNKVFCLLSCYILFRCILINSIPLVNCFHLDLFEGWAFIAQEKVLPQVLVKSWVAELSPAEIFS